MKSTTRRKRTRRASDCAIRRPGLPRLIQRGQGDARASIGDSELICSAIGFGTWEMSTTQYGAIDVQGAGAAVNAALAAEIGRIFEEGALTYVDAKQAI